MDMVAHILVLVVVLYAHCRRSTPYPHTAALKAHGVAAITVIAAAIVAYFVGWEVNHLLSLSIAAHALRSWVYQAEQMIFAYKAKKPLKPEPAIQEEELSAEESALLFAQFAYKEEEDPMMVSSNDSII